MITCVFLLEEKRAKVKNIFQITKSCLFLKKFEEKFGLLKFVRIFAIPNSSGGGEMVDTLL